MNIGEELIQAMNPHEMFSFKLFGFDVPVTDTIVVMWVIMAVIIIGAFILTRNLRTIPQGKQNAAEIVVEFVNNFATDNIGHHGRDFAPYLGTILLFLVISNMASLFNIFPGELLFHLTGNESIQHFGIRPPTRDINVTFCMAVISILTVLFSGIRYKKFSGWLKYLVSPTPIVLPFKLLDYLIRPLSLSLRLFGNIMGAFIAMEILYLTIPVFLPAGLSIYFDLFDGLLQAYVFTFLTSLYIAEAVE